MKRLKVGDVGVVRQLGRGGGERSAEVTKVGRRWATVVDATRTDWVLGKFDRDTGYLDSGSYTSSTRFVTQEQDEHDRRVADARAVLKAAGFETVLGRRVSDGLLFAVAKTITDYAEAES